MGGVILLEECAINNTCTYIYMHDHKIPVSLRLLINMWDKYISTVYINQYVMINNLFHAFKSPFCKKFSLLNLSDTNKEPLFNSFNVLLLFLYKRLI